MIFLDTSVLYAGADENDAECDRANRLLASAVASGEPILTHNYVVVETVALLHRRLGRESAVRFHEQLGFAEVVWVDADLHARAFADFRRRRGRRVSFVDRVSFTVMRDHGIRRALALDEDFEREGFVLYDGR